MLSTSSNSDCIRQCLSTAGWDHSSFLVDRYSERKEKMEKGRLLSQAEKEAARLAIAQAGATAIAAAAAATAETLSVGAEPPAASVLTE